MSYRHTQSAPFYLFLLGVVLLQLVGAWFAYVATNDYVAPAITLASAGLVAGIAFAFQNLTIEDGGEELLVGFGPIPLFGTRIAYREITAVEASESSWIDGWGIHYILGRGWIFNLWGFGCVVVHLGDRVVRLGTDDAENLAGFLKTKIAAT